MTSFAVEWTSTAEDQLADIWLNASDPERVTKAAAAIDLLLAPFSIVTLAGGNGEGRPGHRGRKTCSNRGRRFSVPRVHNPR